MVTDDYNQAAFDMIAALRSGLPECCDFCGQTFGEARYPIPEEAGEWTCSECAARWHAEGLPGYGAP